MTIARLARCPGLRVSCRSLIRSWRATGADGWRGQAAAVREAGEGHYCSRRGCTDRTDNIIAASTYLRADLGDDDDTAALGDACNNLQVLADTGYNFRHNLPAERWRLPHFNWPTFTLLRRA